jgi:hypothetical protein
VAEGEQVLHQAEDGDAERGHAAFQALEVAALEDADERLAAADLELVLIGRVGFVVLQIVRRQLELLDAADDAIVNPA